MGSSFIGRPKFLVNSFVLDGLLIDTGQPRIANTFKHAIKSESISQCVITHHHEDHSGNAKYIQNMQIPTYASPKCVEILKNPPRVSMVQRLTWGQNEAATLLPLDLSKTVNTNKYSFQIIETPGHAEDMIALYEPNQGWLFSADNYVNDYIIVFMDNEVMADHIASLKKLIALDFDVLLCSHNAQFRNGKAYLKSKLEFMSEFYDQVKRRTKKGMKAKEIMVDMNLAEIKMVKWLSTGKLSRINMVRAAMI